MTCLKVVLQPGGSSVDFGVRTLFLKDFDQIRLGRTNKDEQEREDNGLFNIKVVSSNHALLSCKQNQCFLEDRSRNGTFLNGLKMKSHCQYEICNGDIIELGMASFIFDVKIPGVLIDIKISVLEQELPLIKLILPDVNQNVEDEEPVKEETNQTNKSNNNLEFCISSQESTERVCDTQESSQLVGDTKSENYKPLSPQSSQPSQYKITVEPSSQKIDEILKNVSVTKLPSERPQVLSQPNISGTACLEPLSLYFVPPTIEYNLEDLFEHALQRYQLLQIVANSAGNNTQLLGTGYLNIFRSKLKEENSLFYDMIVNNVYDEKILLLDQVSHYCLRLACSRSYEALKWFIRQETKLLHIKWELSTLEMKLDFLKNYKFIFHQVRPEERMDIYSNSGIESDSEEVFYKVHFTEVAELLRNRCVPIVRGVALLTHQQLVYPVTNYYNKYLTSSLQIAKKWNDYYKTPYDPRVFPFFKKISDDIRIKFFNFSVFSFDIVKPADVSQLCKESFPLCMEVLHFDLTRNNHLKNDGRFQLNLFLKGIGLSLNDAIYFWRHYFLKKMTYDEFQKNKYLYFIQHGYGKLGKQADYPPRSCSKIMNSVSGFLDYHGCPFVTQHQEVLMGQLARHDVPEELGLEIWNLVEQGLPQTACSRLFDFKHNLTSKSAPTDHPNIYYNRSRSLRKTIKIAEENSAKEKPSTAEENSAVKCSCEKMDVDW